MKRIFSITVLCIATLALLKPASASMVTVAYTIPATEPGNQSAFNTSLGLDFDVNAPIDVTDLGVFDGSGDGIDGTLFVTIFDRNTQLTVSPTLSFTGSGDTLVGAVRFRSIIPLHLLPGNYTVAAWGFGGLDPDGCSICGNQFTLSTEDTGGGLITFVGSGRYGGPGGSYPGTPFGGPTNAFHAGNFRFTVIPEPGSLGMFGLGGAMLLGLFKLRKARITSKRRAGIQQERK